MRTVKHFLAAPRGNGRRIAKLFGGMLFITGLASAGLVGDGDGESIVMTPAPCMSELYKAKGGSGGLNCTSNDIRVAGVATKVVGGQTVPDLEFVDVVAPGETLPHQGCRFPGDTVRFKARFNVVLSATARYDIGIFFAVDGDDNGDGAYNSDNDVKAVFNPQKQYVSGGGCIAATPQYKPSPFINLDGVSANPATQDRCGDISGNAPLQPLVEVTTLCTDKDNDSFVDLPVCLSWRQPGANEFCGSPEDAYPGAPSKCNCDAGFEVPIIIPPGTITVEKTANPTVVLEPGGLVTFTVTAKNDAPSGANAALNLTVNHIVDSVFGVIFDPNSADDTNNALVPSATNTCLTVNKVIAGGATMTCTFKANVAGNGGDTHNNLVTVEAVNTKGTPVPPQSDDATVTIQDVMPTISVIKTANPTSVQEPGGNVSYTVRVTNPAMTIPATVAVEPLTLTALMDDKFGNLDGKGTCDVPQTIAKNSYYECTFTGFVGGAPNTTHVNEVEGTAQDDDGNTIKVKDTAAVDILNTPSDFSVTKTASSKSLNEPGGTVTFTVKVTNTSPTDAVTINSLIDSVYGDLTNLALNPGSTCQVPKTIPATNPDSFYQCTFTKTISGNAGTSHTNVAEACGVDDDNVPLCRNGTETVTIVNMAPAATLTKTVDSAKVTFKVEVRNNSNAQDPIKLNSLVDAVNGVETDITVQTGSILSTTCQTGGTIQPNAVYSCKFEALITDSQTDTVTGKLKDDENTDVSPDPSDSATVNLVD